MKISNQAGRTLNMKDCSDIDYVYRAGSEAAAEGDYEKALRYLDHVLQANPKHARAWNVKGNCLDGLGKYNEALNSYDNALKLDPLNADILFNKAETLEQMGKAFDAQVLMDKAIKMEIGA